MHTTIIKMGTNLSIATDYKEDTGNPEPYLKKISQAGFTHVHWCHEWNTDHLYSEPEINQIIQWLEKYNLKILDIHASKGQKDNWVSKNKEERRRGLDLVKNRIKMTSKLSSDVIVLHYKQELKNDTEREEYWKNFFESLDNLEPYARKHNVRIALENSTNEGHEEIESILSKYSPEFLGYCYDSGHGNINNDGLLGFDKLKDRTISIHLHDNDEKTDSHNLLFSGTINWEKLAKIIPKSSYEKPIIMEVSMKNSGITEEEEFLSKAHETGLAFLDLIKA